MALIAPLPSNEEQRLEWLRQCEILDTLPEAAFDEVARMAAEVCRVPIAAINLVDQDRQWSKAAVGQDKDQGSRDVSFCAHAILQPDLMVVPDARGDWRFADNPLVTGDPYIRFYAGAPLITSEGLGLGSLCVVDRVPRQLTEEQAALLRLLAQQIVGRLELLRHIALHKEMMAERERLMAEARQTAAWQRGFLRDVLSSVTGRRLRLCWDRSDLPHALESASGWVDLAAPGGIRDLRQCTKEAALASGFDETRWRDLITASSEAAMNAVVHGGGGRGRVYGTGNKVQVWVEDNGPGIAMDRLPLATLERGYSSAGTLGYGMKMMLDTVDHVYLLTGTAGTTVVIEQDREQPLPSWLSGEAEAGKTLRAEGKQTVSLAE